jgi:hypothetical protein
MVRQGEQHYANSNAPKSHVIDTQLTAQTEKCFLCPTNVTTVPTDHLCINQDAHQAHITTGSTIVYPHRYIIENSDFLGCDAASQGNWFLVTTYRW